MTAGPSTSIGQVLRRGTGHVHLAGICGVGMAGLALLLKERGFTVTGCDLVLNRLAPWLNGHGIRVLKGHAATHIEPDVEWLVRSAAVTLETPEIEAAAARGLPVFRRGEILPALLVGTTSVAVCGTHGKTTTTGYITQMLKTNGRDPSFCIGGDVPSLQGVAGCGRGGCLVVEADESDGTLALYAPDFTVVTNIEFDHMEHFPDVAAFEACFRSVIRNTRQRVVFCADDPRAARLCRAGGGAVSYGFGPAADVRAKDLEERVDETRFTLVHKEQAQGTVVVSAPGRHNALNALAAAAIGFEMGLSFEQIRLGLAGVERPRRRFEKVVCRDDTVVVSDYAHHPTEIAACVRTALRLKRNRTLAVFQPHRYTRTQALGADFPAAFAGVDELILVPVYAASEKPLPGGSVWDLYTHCRRHAGLNVHVATSLRQAWDYLRHAMRSGDLLLVIGAGDVERIAEWAGEELPSQHADDLGASTRLTSAVVRLGLKATVAKARATLANRTSIHVGGQADLWLEIGNEQDLISVVQWAHGDGIPFHVLGAGSNVLVSDLGVRGVAIRLAGAAFRAFQWKDGILSVGAGSTLARLTAWAEENSLTGLEFLHGIPGTVGGAVRGNAGAWDTAVGDRVAWVRCVTASGQAQTLMRRELDFTYRDCPALDGKVVLEAGLMLEEGQRQAIQRTMREIAERRAWMRGQRSAGCVFRNPPGDYAGRLIEQCGLKGYRVGGASISDRHANVIVTDENARSSDVKAVIEKAREEVRQRFAIELKTEIVFVE